MNEKFERLAERIENELAELEKVTGCTQEGWEWCGTMSPG